MKKKIIIISSIGVGLSIAGYFIHSYIKNKNGYDPVMNQKVINQIIMRTLLKFVKQTINFLYAKGHFTFAVIKMCWNYKKY